MAQATLDRYTDGYAPHEERPLGGYLTLMTVYGAASLAAGGLARLLGRRVPDRVPLCDVALLGIATHKVSRLLAKDAVASPLRAPFVRYEEPAGEGEVNESPRGHGLQHSVGELISCPFCLAVWVATGLTAGTVLAPKLTRLVTAGAAAVATADFLHLAYDSLKQMTTIAQKAAE